jgi:hypothetical protein
MPDLCPAALGYHATGDMPRATLAVYTAFFTFLALIGQ